MAIIAGSGLLPFYIAEAARAAGEDPFIAALKSDAGSDWNGYDHINIGVGDYAGLAAAFNGNGVDRVVLSGAVARRPEWREVRPTLRSLLKVPSVVRTLMSGGDDTVLRMVIQLIEANGWQVLGAQDIAPNLLAAVGAVGSLQPDPDDRRDIRQAAEAARMLGALDVGQGAVCVGGRIVALEGVEGTDQMLLRVASLRAEGRISSRRRGVLVKLCKPQQDLRADLPSIGLSTVYNAASAGLAGIAVEAGRALILQRDEVKRAADDAGLFVCGIDRGLPGGGI